MGTRTLNRTPLATRSARNADLPAIRALLADCGLPPQGIETCLRHCRVVERDGRLVASGAIERCAGALLLRSLAVAATDRRHGVAALLVAALEHDAQELGASELWLLTDTASEWFTTRGYRARARDEAPAGIRAHAQFHSLCPASARLMHRVL